MPRITRRVDLNVSHSPLLPAARRPHRLLLATLLAGLALGLSSSAAGGAAATTAVCTADPQGYVGMVAQDVLVGSSRYRNSQLAAMHAAGVTLLRQVFDWSIVERRRGRYDFSAYDSFVADAAKHGIEVMPILFNEPSYYSSRPRHSKAHGTYPPKQLSTIAAFATAAVKWYGPSGGFWKAHRSLTPLPIRAWEIWNEPNLNVYWLPRASASAYVSLLSAAARAIRALDSGAEIVSAGLPLSTLPGVNLFTYLSQLLHAGAAQWLTSIGINAYARTASGMLTLLQKVRQTLNAAGGSALALRVTEFGWSDKGPGSQFRLGPSGQATQLASLIALLSAQRSSLDLRGFVYYGWRDARPYRGAGDFWGLHTGLITLSGKSKPALHSFATAVAALCKG
jgi:hypothetical protein